MKSTALLATVLLLTPLAAAQRRMLGEMPLEKRQSQAFRPPITYISGTCEEQGLTSCGAADCVDFSIGQECCHETYGCTSRSFCLVDGYCCPDGEDPETCARRNSVELPDDFTTATSYSPPGSSATTVSSTAVSSTSTAYSISIPSVYVPSIYVPSVYVPSATGTLPVPSNVTLPSATAAPPVYTGAAARAGAGAWVAAAAAAVAGVLV